MSPLLLKSGLMIISIHVISNEPFMSHFNSTRYKLTNVMIRNPNIYQIQNALIHTFLKSVLYYLSLVILISPQDFHLIWACTVMFCHWKATYVLLDQNYSNFTSCLWLTTYRCFDYLLLSQLYFLGCYLKRETSTKKTFVLCHFIKNIQILVDGKAGESFFKHLLLYYILPASQGTSNFLLESCRC